MSDQNVRLMHRVTEEFNMRDIEALIAYCDPGVEFHSEPEAYFDLDEQTLAFHIMHGRGRQSGAEVAMPIAAVYRWRDGLLVNWKGYVQREDALRDLGVSEDELEPIEP